MSRVAAFLLRRPNAVERPEGPLELVELSGWQLEDLLVLVVLSGWPMPVLGLLVGQVAELEPVRRRLG